MTAETTFDRLIETRLALLRRQIGSGAGGGGGGGGVAGFAVTADGDLTLGYAGPAPTVSIDADGFLILEV